jgi:hypothetical protein
MTTDDEELPTLLIAILHAAFCAGAALAAAWPDHQRKAEPQYPECGYR